MKTVPNDRRKRMRADLASGRTLRYAGAYSPIVGKLLEGIGYDGVAVTGASVAAELGLPDIALFSLTELAENTRQIANATNLPSMIDADTGFGEPQNAFRTMREIESAGASAVFLEDQITDKRCGHLDNKKLVDVKTMARRLSAASEARLDEDMILCARTDARAEFGLQEAIDRAKAYVDAGADMIFPEALHDEREFEQFRRAVSVPIMANMTAFGQTKLITYESFRDLGIEIVCYPNETLRLALHAVEVGMRKILEDGTQSNVLESLQKRSRLYELLDYDAYGRFDPDLFNFQVPDGSAKTRGQRTLPNDEGAE